MPKNVRLVEPDDFDAHRADIFDGVHEAVKSSFPKSYGGVRMELADTAYEGPEDFSPQEQKEAILKNKFLTRRLRGTVRLFDDKTNEMLDETRTTLMNVPWLSPRGTFVHGGNDYAPINQMRLVPGPYARTMANGQLEVHFNSKPGSGTGYRVLFEPESAQYKLKVGPQMHAHLYSVLHDMGVQDETLEKSWGKDILERNRSKYNPKALKQVYTNLVPTKEQIADGTPQQQAEQLRAALERTQLLLSTARHHLPGMLDAVKRASVQKELRETDSHDKEDLHDQFEPDLTPAELRENVNALQGKAGPRLAGGDWPASWSTEQDNLGWLAWYEQYHHGRRSEDDRKQIQRWLRFRRLQVPKFVAAPTPRRAFGLRNWAIDPEKLVTGEQLKGLQQDMKDYKEAKWADWTAKRAAMTVEELTALVQYLNEHEGANIVMEGTKEDIEDRVMAFINNTITPGDAAMQQASALPAIQPIKMAALAGMLRSSDRLHCLAHADGVLIKSARAHCFINDPVALDLLSEYLLP